MTGANRGIGLALATALVARETFAVIATVRDAGASSELETLARRTGRLTIADLDLNEEPSIVSFAQRAATLGPFDLVIHNAGIMGSQRLSELTFDNVLADLRTNMVGPAVLTRHLRPHLRRGGLLVFISSRLGSIGVADGRQGYPYRASKAALNMVARQLSFELRDDGIGVLIMSPGQVQTRMNHVPGAISPDESAAGLLREIDAFTMDRTGTFRRYDGSTLPW